MILNLIHFISDHLRFNLHGIFSVASGFLCLALGLLVLIKDHRSKPNQVFSFFTFNAAVWIIFYGGASLLKEGLDPFPMIATSHVGIPFIPVSMYLLVLLILKKPVRRLVICAGYGWALSEVIWFASTNGRISLVNEYPWGRYSIWQPKIESGLNALYLILPFYTFTLLGFKELYRGYKDSNLLHHRIQLRNILIAFLVAYTGSVDFIPAFGFNIYPFGYISLTAFTCIVAYTIIRHRFLDIRFVLKRITLVAIIYSILLLVSLPFTIPLFIRLVKDPSQNPIVVMALFGICSGFILSLGPLIYAYVVRHTFWLKNYVTTGLTHELKSPLGAIQSAAEIILEDLNGDETDKVKLIHYAAMVRNNATRMETFVKDLLQVAKIQDDTVAVNKETIDLRETITGFIQSLKPLTDQKGIHMQFEPDGSIPINADPEKIQQVISNLLSNAIKFSERGTITIDLQHSKKEVICSVTDQGRGIDPKHLNKIFDRFYQVSSNSKGSGIGLTIAKAWVEAHGGRIWAESEGEGRGTKVTFTLPV